MDLSNPMIDESIFHSNADWVEFYGDMAEEDPLQMKEPISEPVSTFNFFDSDYASNVVTKRPHTGILLFFAVG